MVPEVLRSTILGRNVDMDMFLRLFLFRGAFQPNDNQAPCAPDEITYDGYCFIPALRDLTLLYTDQQLMITGILIMPPQWARRHNTDCKQANQDFCAPDEGGPFGRFTGFLAWYFNGQNGNGRISDFVIMNEVNAAEWYNVGCGDGKRCDVDKWVHSYGQVYNAAYDHIRRHQPEAPVLISFEHNFGSQLDVHLSNASPVSELCWLFLTMTFELLIGCVCGNILANTCATAGTSSMVAGVSCLCTGSSPCGVQSQRLAESDLWQYQSTGGLADAELSSHTIGTQGLSH